MEKTDAIDFPKSVLNLRLKLDKSQAWLAEKLNVSETTVSNWERGFAVPFGRNAYKIVTLMEEYEIEPVLLDNGNDQT